ncbi:MAG: hypothetical protein ACI9K3_001549, partial [Halovenus sp.]
LVPWLHRRLTVDSDQSEPPAATADD